MKKFNWSLMSIKKSKKISGYILISITAILLAISSMISAILLFQKRDVDISNQFYEFRDLNEQIYAIHHQVLNDYQNAISQYSHFNQNEQKELTLEGENNFFHSISISPSDGCVNLTALIYKDLDGSYRGMELERKRFQFIFMQLNLNPALVDRLIDYQDSNSLSSADPTEQEVFYKNKPFIHISEAIDLLNLKDKEAANFIEFFCVNQIDRKFNLKAMPLDTISLLFPFVSTVPFQTYLKNNPYLNLQSIQNWKEYLIQYLKRSLTPQEENFFQALSVQNKSIEILVRSSKKELNWYTKFKLEMPNQGNLMTAYQLGPFIIDE